MSTAYLVTGSSGFIGSHFCTACGRLLGRRSILYGIDIAVPDSGIDYTHTTADIRLPESLSQLSIEDPQVIIHLAAKAEVVTPFAETGDLGLTNVGGTANLLQHLKPRTFIFASSSAVYGNSGSRGVPPSFSHVKPVGTYGVSKVFGELICADWCRERRGSAVAFRFGNVVGAQSRGFIPFLVRHAQMHPEGDEPAQCRGKGRVLRDYVPVDYIVALLWAAAARKWEAAEFRVFNAGTGRGMTNGEVAEVVGQILLRHGYRLNICWESPLAPGESKSIVLEMKETEKTFGLPVPDRASVVAAIEQSVLSWLARPLAVTSVQGTGRTHSQADPGPTRPARRSA